MNAASEGLAAWQGVAADESLKYQVEALLFRFEALGLVERA